MRRRVSEIARLENSTEAEVEGAIGEIAKLSTSPAHEFARDDDRFVYADVAYKKTPEGAWTAELTNEYVPKLRINQEYRKMASGAAVTRDGAAYISSKIREGKFIIEAIEHRQKTLLKIALAILGLQPEFFERGAGALKPMTMQDVADLVGRPPDDCRARGFGKIRRHAVRDTASQKLFRRGLRFRFRRGRSQLVRKGAHARDSWRRVSPRAAERF